MKTKNFFVILSAFTCIGLIAETAVLEIKDNSSVYAAVIHHGDRDNISLFQELPSGDAARIGMWSAVGNWPLYAIHAAVLPNGSVLSYGTDERGRGLGLRYDVWEPVRGLTSNAHLTLPVTTDTNVFCAAQNVLTNGSLLIAGGDMRPDGPGGYGIYEANLFNYRDDTMTLTQAMVQGRWYPTLTVMPNGHVLVHGGRVNKETPTTLPEIYNPAKGTWKSLTSADAPHIYDQKNKGWYYPRTFVNNKGRAFFFAAGHSELFELDVKANNGTGRVRQVGQAQFPFKLYYPAVNFRPGKVLAFHNSRHTSIVDIDHYTVTAASDIPVNRVWSDATVLADGTIVVTGGASVRQDLETAERSAMLYNPDNNRWTVGASAKRARLYHSSTVLLPSGAVLAIGGGPPGPVNQLNAEVYYPPYLFDETGWAKRPVIKTGKRNMRYSIDYQLTYEHNREIARISMVKLGSATHSWDMGQSYREVPFTRNQNEIVLLATGRKRNNMTPGFYMVFLIDDLGVPSEAKIVRLVKT